MAETVSLRIAYCIQKMVYILFVQLRVRVCVWYETGMGKQARETDLAQQILE
jgi:hypothetical protein